MDPKIELMLTIIALFTPVKDLFFSDAVFIKGNNAYKNNIIKLKKYIILIIEDFTCVNIIGPIVFILK